jgi:kynurenine 3-monooxygenase
MKKVIIVGAGLVGALWAVYMARRGYKIVIYERRPDMRKATISAGKSINLAMSDRGLKALDNVGLGDDIREIAIPMPGRMIHDPDGELSFQRYGQEGQHINSVSRAGLNMLLMDKAEAFDDVQIIFDSRCEEVDLEHNKITFINDETGERTHEEADLIFGTDGAFSAVRGAMQITDRFDYSQSYIKHGYKELLIPPGEGENLFRIEKEALHIWPRRSFMLIALPNIDGSFTVTLFLPFEGEHSFATLNSDDAVRKFFEEQFGDAVEHMPTLIDDFNENPTSSLAIIRCYPWNVGGRVALMGDAAHAIIPFYGQGMNAGFEDCTVLDQLIDEHGEDNWEKVFDLYTEMRKPNGDAIADLALKNFVEMRDKVADELFLKRKKLELKLQQEHPEFIPQYSLVSFTHTSYADAKRFGEAQDKVFEKLMNIEDVENRLDDPLVIEHLEELFAIK